MHVQPEAAGHLAHIGRRGRPEEQLESLVFQRRRLGQEREDPPAAVVEHDEGAGNVGQVDQPRDVVQEGQVARGAQPCVGPRPRCPGRSRPPRRFHSPPDWPSRSAAPRASGRTIRDRGWAWRPTPSRWLVRRRVTGQRSGPRAARSAPGPGLVRWRPGPRPHRPARSRAMPRSTGWAGCHRPCESGAATQLSPDTWWNSLTTTDGSVHCHQGSTQMTRAPLAAGIRHVLAQGLGKPGRAEQHHRRRADRGWVRTMASAAAMVPGPGIPIGDPPGSATRAVRPGAAAGPDRSRHLAPAMIKPRAAAAAASERHRAPAARPSRPTPGQAAAATGPDRRRADHGRRDSDAPARDRAAPAGASANARAANGRHDRGLRLLRHPGIAAHRVEVVNRPTWSMVCEAPTWCSSGGRSAVQTMRGTRP